MTALSCSDVQAEGVVTGSELSRWRASWGEAAEAQWAAAGRGKYKESAAQFLVSTWQGDALMVRRDPAVAGELALMLLL
jgi:hypothetical protein